MKKKIFNFFVAGKLTAEHFEYFFVKKNCA